MKYEYRLEDYSSKYSELTEKYRVIVEELNKAVNTLSGIENRETEAKEEWLEAETSALLDASKTNVAMQANKDYQQIQAERQTLIGRIEILGRASEKIQQEIDATREEALEKMLKAAKKDHEKLAAKSFKIMQDLAKAQEEEEEIYSALTKHIGQTSLIMPTQKITKCDLKLALMRVTEQLVEKRGYKL